MLDWNVSFHWERGMLKARLVKVAKSQGLSVVVSVVLREMKEASVVGRKSVVRSPEIILVSSLIVSVSMRLFYE